MSAEWFAKLKEYDSLSKSRMRHLASQQEQRERINKLSLQRNQREEELAKLKSDYLERQGLLAEKESQIKLLSEQRQRLLDYGGDENKVTELSDKINQLETDGFSLLEELESNEQEREDTRTFIEGITRTIGEIQKEVDEVVASAQQEIERLDLRLQLLHDELPADFKDRLSRALSKNLMHGPFTRIDQGSCYLCRFKISRIEESEIDIHKQLKNCPQCGRIFIPFGT